MGIELTAHLEEYIKERLAAGRNGSAIEVIEEAFEALSERDEELNLLLAQRDELLEALDQADRGEFCNQSIPEMIEEFRREHLEKTA